MTLHKRVLVLLAALILIGEGSAMCDHIACEGERGCEAYDGISYCMTSRFWFEAEPVSGVPGDVVGVTISLHYSPGFDLELNGIRLAVCHDPTTTQLAGEPVYSEEIVEREPILLQFFPVQEDEFPGLYPDAHSGYGFLADILLLELDAVSKQIPLMTVYYRVTGAPGEVSEIAFCEDSLVRFRRTCNFSGIREVDHETFDHQWPLLSTRNRNATVTIHDGPVTRPDRPPEPPAATVYPEPPTSDDVNLRVRVGSAVAAPGARDVPVEVFVTADLEYTGVVVPIDFDERYLRVARVEDNFLSGTAVVSNDDALPGAQPEEGHAVLVSSLFGTRRIAPAGEEFHAATVYFDVLESAAGIAETALEVAPVGAGPVYDPVVVVRYLGGDSADPVEATSEFGAVEISGGFVAIRASLDTIAGDANFDGAFDVSDPLAVLGFLFQGAARPLCPPAADYNGDGAVVISDPIAMLGVLFLGQTRPATSDGGRVDCQ